jgi:hypothetical protein
MSSHEPDVIIWGVTIHGRTFRPGDWAERLAGPTSAFEVDQTLAYSPLVRRSAFARCAPSSSESRENRCSLSDGENDFLGAG